MREILHMAWETYAQYNGMAMHMGVFLAALLFLHVFHKTKTERANAYFLSGYTVMFFMIFFCPLTAKIIMEYCIGANVYWRMFWILPISVVVAYAFAASLRETVRWKRAVLMTGMALAIMVTGSAVYTSENFTKAQNIYKLPQEAIDVCQIINEDARENDIEEKRAIVVNELLSYIRQYDGSIQMPYGRNALKGEKLTNKNSKKIFKLMCNPQVDWQNLVKSAEKGAYNYLVYYRDETVEQELQDLGYKRIGDGGGYFVYRREW